MEASNRPEDLEAMVYCYECRKSTRRLVLLGLPEGCECRKQACLPGILDPEPRQLTLAACYGQIEVK